MEQHLAEPSTRLQGNSLGLAHIVFFVVAAAAPLTAVVGTAPAAFAFGNGPGVPGAFVLAGALYLVFSVGFAAMTRHVSGAGGFYVFIANGLNVSLGIAGAFLALLTYSAVQLAVYALLGVFAHDATLRLGLDVPWNAWSVLALVAVLLCGQRNIAVSGHILGACMVAEFAILLLLDLAIIRHNGGGQGLSVSNFAPSVVFGKGLGAALVFVVGSFIGFESTAIFGEEAKDSGRTIRTATFLAVSSITLFYAFSTWAIAQFYGFAEISAVAAAQPDRLFFNAAAVLLGDWAVDAMNILLIISLGACALSMHSTLSRYLFALGREGLMPAALGRVHHRHGSPHRAGALQSAMALALLALCIASGLDPYGQVFAWASAIAVIGVLFLQSLVCAAIIGFFRARPDITAGRGSVLLAPLASLAGLICFLVLVLHNLPLLVGSATSVLWVFPLFPLGVFAMGWFFAQRVKRRDPGHFAGLGKVLGETG